MEQPKEELHVEGGDQPQPEEAAQTEGSNAAPAAAEEKKASSFFSAPQNFGNSAGDTINSTLGKIGNPVGKGLETVAKPVGGIVDPVVGGLFRSHENFARASDEGKSVDKHNEELKQPIAGEEQTAGNPLGLNQGGLKE
ncbi:hypothetical protein ACLMJK_002572 [Lecanora helva]